VLSPSSLMISVRKPACSPGSFGRSVSQIPRSTRAGIHSVNRERLVQPHARHFPVAGRGVLSRRARRAFSVGPQRRGPPAPDLSAAISRARAPPDSESRARATPRYAQRAPANLMVVRRVGKLTDPHAVEHDPENLSNSPMDNPRGPI